MHRPMGVQTAHTQRHVPTRVFTSAQAHAQADAPSRSLHPFPTRCGSLGVPGARPAEGTVGPLLSTHAFCLLLGLAHPA